MLIIRGHINQKGTIDRELSDPAVVASGKSGTGKYRVNFKPGTFKKPPVVVATVMASTNKADQTGTNRTISVTYYSDDEFQVGIRKASGNNESDDRPFMFIACGE